MMELPLGWTDTSLGEVIELRYGKSLTEKDRLPGDFGVYGSNGLVGSHITSITDAPAIVVGRKGSIGEVHFSERACFPIDTTYFVDRFDCAEPRFVLHLLGHLPLRKMNRASAVPGLNREDAYRLPIALPPLPEQRRIVAKIDSLLAKSRRNRDHLDHIPRLVEKYKQAILAAAFRGDLTREWRASHDKSSDWQTVTAGKVIQSIVAGKNLRCEERPPLDHERGVLKVSAVSWGSFDPKATKTLPSNFNPPDQTRVRSGDFLISRANTLELVGAVVIVRQTPPNLFLSDKILRLEIRDDAKPWMLWFLRSPGGRTVIEASATGNQLSMRNLSQAALREIDVPWPNELERNEIVRRIDRLFAWIDRLALEATSARKLIDHLDQAMLAKAFRGDLVTQDPNDEPASVLLERIRAERATATPIKRGAAPSVLPPPKRRKG